MALILSGDTGVPASGMPTGSVIQTVTATYSTNVPCTGTTLVDSLLTATITPQFSNSKILVVFTQSGINTGSTATTGVKIVLLRNGTSVYTGAIYQGYISSAIYSNTSFSGQYLDSPATTSALTYKTQFASSNAGSISVQSNGETSTIILQEIKV